MAKRTVRDRGKEAFWRDTLRKQGRSGLTIRAYCRKHHLGESLFYFWRRELVRWDAIRTQRPFVPVLVRETDRASSREYDGVSRAKDIGGHLEIELVGGYRVSVSGPVDRQALRDVLAVLEGASC